jgi:hypothetical protein
METGQSRAEQAGKGEGHLGIIKQQAGRMARMRLTWSSIDELECYSVRVSFNES